MSNNAYKPYVPADQAMKEISFKAILLGIILAIILGAANAYLGLLVGMTVAATFPAAVISMAVLRIFKGTILEENFARTTGAVGEALAAGAIFTIPAFLITGVWEKFDLFKSSMLMLVGGILGVFLIILVRRTLVEDADLPFPESVACAEMVKTGQKGDPVPNTCSGRWVWAVLSNSSPATAVCESSNLMSSPYLKSRDCRG